MCVDTSRPAPSGWWRSHEQSEQPTTSGGGSLAASGAAGVVASGGVVGAGGVVGVAAGGATPSTAPGTGGTAAGGAASASYASSDPPGAGTAGMAAASAGSAGAGCVAGAGGLHVRDDCTDGETADATDAMLTGALDVWTRAVHRRGRSAPPQRVLTWMHDRKWEIAHDAGHNVRRCKRGGPPPSSTAICAHAELVSHQECADAEDGYEFATHRHMLMHLRQVFPTHTDLFKGSLIPHERDRTCPSNGRADGDGLPSPAYRDMRTQVLEACQRLMAHLRHGPA